MELLGTLHKADENTKKKQENKNTKKRYMAGLKEVTRKVELEKAKCVFIAHSIILVCVVGYLHLSKYHMIDIGRC